MISTGHWFIVSCVSWRQWQERLWMFWAMDGVMQPSGFVTLSPEGWMAEGLLLGTVQKCCSHSVSSCHKMYQNGLFWEICHQRYCMVFNFPGLQFHSPPQTILDHFCKTYPLFRAVEQWEGNCYISQTTDKKEGDRHFSRVCYERTKGKWFQIERGEN